VIFDRVEGWATIWAHLNSPPPRVTSIRPDLSPAVDQVLARALAKAPQTLATSGTNGTAYLWRIR
jgi:serine/threonine-protein kinase